MTCQNIRTAIDSSSPCEPFSPHVTNHLTTCEGCCDYAAEMTALFAMMGDMPRVKAPNDFDFKLRARIHQAKTAPAPQNGLGFFNSLWSIARGEATLSWGQISAVGASAMLAITMTAVLLRNNPTNPAATMVATTSTPEKPAAVVNSAVAPTEPHKPVVTTSAASVSRAGGSNKLMTVAHRSAPGNLTPVKQNNRGIQISGEGLQHAVLVQTGQGKNALPVSNYMFGAQLAAASARNAPRATVTQAVF